jgi:hypothetical protein
MPKRLFVLLGLFFLLIIPARAQQLMEIFAGYSYEGLDRLPNGIPGRNLHGAEISVQYKFTDWLGVVGEVDGHFGLPSEPASKSLNILVGPQFSLPGRISPFAHVLIGYGHGYTNGIWDNSFSMAIGGGLDLSLAPLLSWRMVEADDVMTHYFGGTEHNPRVSTGFVFRF